jgi:hypothetical protein
MTIKKMRKYTLFPAARLLFLLAAFLPMLFIASAGLAQLKDPDAPLPSSKNFSENEKAVFAYFKMTGRLPYFAQMIEEMNSYKNEASMYKKQKIFQSQSLRLQQEFGTYDPKTDYLEIKADVMLQLRTDKETPTLNFKFPDSGKVEIPYFSYPYGKERIAVIVSDLDRFTSIPLSGEQFEKIGKLFEPKKVYRGKVFMKLRPVDADSKEPMAMDEAEHWLLLCDVAYLEFTHTSDMTGRKEILGAYQAPWNTQPTP